MKFTQVAADAFSKLQLNAGVLLTEFDPTTPTLDKTKIFAATSGGVTFNSGPQFVDFGEDIDNVPANTKQLKRIDYYDVHLTGTAKTVDAPMVEALIAAADTTTSGGTSTVTPRSELTATDFQDIWWVGDYSDKNGATNGGFLAVQLKDVINTGGFQITSNDNGKGEFAFDFQAHYDLDDIDSVPFAVYVKTGTAE